MRLASDLRTEARWLLSGFLLMFFSGFGQTYFIALFAGSLKAELSLTDGELGGLYTLGTLASAILLAWAGRLADTVSIRWLGAGVLGGLAATAAVMATVRSPLMLALVIFGLRFFGQGMLTHTSMTAMGRWFNRKRGRAVSIAGIGLPASEGLLPPLTVSVVALVGWRETWLIAAAVLLLLACPLFVILLKHERHPTRGPIASSTSVPPDDRHQWTRFEVLRHPLFYALLPGMLASPFIVTAVLFNQVTLVRIKGWSLEWFAATFPVLAGAHVVAALTAGWMIDRYGARRLLALYLTSLGFSTLCLALASGAFMLAVVMLLLGFALGFGSATTNALWPELYGTGHLGAIRSMVTSLVVLSTAMAPGLVGLLLDAGLGFETQLLGMSAYSFAAAGGMLFLLPALNRMAR